MVGGKGEYRVSLNSKFFNKESFVVMISDNNLTLMEIVEDKIDEVLNHVKKTCDASMPNGNRRTTLIFQCIDGMKKFCLFKLNV